MDVQGGEEGLHPLIELGKFRMFSVSYINENQTGFL